MESEHAKSTVKVVLIFFNLRFICNIFPIYTFAWEGIYRLVEEIMQQNTSNKGTQSMKDFILGKAEVPIVSFSPRLLTRPRASYNQGPCPSHRSYFLVSSIIPGVKISIKVLS